MIDKIENYFGIKEPDIPKEPDYENVVKYLVASQIASVNYYRIVFRVGVVGLIFSTILLLKLVGSNDWDWSIIFKVKEYPGMIASLITMSFGHIEMEGKKKELYSQLQNISQNFKSENDEKSIADDYKKWTWTEFQNKFKPE